MIHLHIQRKYFEVITSLFQFLIYKYQHHVLFYVRREPFYIFFTSKLIIIKVVNLCDFKNECKFPGIMVCHRRMYNQLPGHMHAGQKHAQVVVIICMRRHVHTAYNKHNLCHVHATVNRVYRPSLNLRFCQSGKQTWCAWLT